MLKNFSEIQKNYHKNLGSVVHYTFQVANTQGSGYKSEINWPLYFQPFVSFIIQAQLPPTEAHRYRYEVHLELPANGPQRTSRNYLGMVQSLELSCNDILTNHRRNIG